jgi:hypothetical protein
MIKLDSTIKGGHKATQDAVKQVKQLVKTIDKIKAESATLKRKMDDLANQLETLKKKINTGKAEQLMRNDDCHVAALHLVDRESVRGIVRDRPSGCSGGAFCPPKLRKIVSEAAHSMWGLTNMSLQVWNRSFQPCVVVGTSFPNWILHVEELGYKIDHVLIQSPIYLTSIQRICGSAIPVWSGSNLAESVSNWSPTGSNLVCFVDGRVTSIVGVRKCTSNGNCLFGHAGNLLVVGCHQAFVTTSHTFFLKCPGPVTGTFCTRNEYRGGLIP